MVYFIDFEATQFSNEIISIGCISETGAEFYSQVKAKKKITPFITSLTGISDEDNKDAPSTDEVFKNFFEWLKANSDGKVIFYCYGNADFNFVKKNLENTNNLYAQAALSIIGMNLYDYSKTIKNHFGLIKNIALNKIVAYYRNVPYVNQTHNALDDAIWLKEVYDHVSKEDPIQDHPFPEYEIEPNSESKIIFNADLPKSKLKELKHKIFTYNKYGVLEETFDSLIDAREWIFSKLGKIDQSVADKRKIENKIINASLNKKSYKGYDWKIIIL